MQSLGESLQRLVTGVTADRSYRNRVLGAAVALVLLVGAFSSGLEVHVRFGRRHLPAAASAAAVPAGSPASPVASPRPEPSASRPLAPAAPAPALAPPAPVALPGPLTAAGTGPGTSPSQPSSPGAGPSADDEGQDEGADEAGRCVVTDTLVLLPTEDAEETPLREECEGATAALDEARHGGDAEPSDPPAPAPAPASEPPAPTPATAQGVRRV